MADVERERVTALWREAAAAVEEIRFGAGRGSDTKGAGSPDIPRPTPCVECGHLREQLATTADYIASALTSLETGPGKDPYAYALLCAARAALGVEGEQEKP